MGYKETVMRDSQISDITKRAMNAPADREIAIAQAQKTWNIAATHGFEIGYEQGRSGKEKAKERGLEAGKVLGRKEVVEWIRGNTVYFDGVATQCRHLWGEKLKEWGIDK